MQLVIADTGPVNYLLLIGHIEILPALFEKVILPSAVKDELANPATPLPVRNWIAAPPLWVDIRHTAIPLTNASMGGSVRVKHLRSRSQPNSTPICSSWMTGEAC